MILEFRILFFPIHKKKISCAFLDKNQKHACFELLKYGRLCGTVLELAQKGFFPSEAFFLARRSI